jgi:hypothetical protein
VVKDMILKRKKRNYLKQIYKQNPETDAYIIEVSLDNYNEVFNGWDPSPIKRRDLDPDLLKFIQQCSHDIPLKFPVELHFYMPQNLYDESKEGLTRDGVINNFKFIVHFAGAELFNNRKKIFMYIIMSFFFLSMASIVRQQASLGVLSSIAIEGMFIGGWVFLWEAFSLFFFVRQETVTRLKRIRRFIDTPIYFYYQ